MSGRLSYEASLQRLRDLGWFGADEHPPLPARMPHPDDDEPFGVRIFRTLIDDADLAGLTLPRTFFGRSELNRVSFVDTDLNQSYLCWTDFIDVSFEAADLSGADMRSSIWTRVSFRNANLSGADLRRSFFEDCDFTGAEMAGVVLTDTLDLSSVLSAEQLAAIAWADEEGPEPEGG